MTRRALLPALVATSDRLAKPETPAVPGSGTAGPASSPDFDRTRLGIAAKIDIAASVNTDCAEPAATHSETLDPSFVLLQSDKNPG